MADSKISAITLATVAAGANEFPINEAGTTKKLTVTLLRDLIGVQKACITGSAHSVSATTQTEVTDLRVAIGAAGAYVFEYFLIVRSSGTGTCIRFAVDYTGTESKIVYRLEHMGSGTTGANATSDDVFTGLGGQVGETGAANAAGTTAGLVGSAAVVTAASDMFYRIHGTFVCSDTGNLALWHGSGTAAATTVEVGSNVTVTRVN